MGVTGYDEIDQLLDQLFGDEDQSRRWLQRPAPGLGERVPREMLDASEGRLEVERLLVRIRDGGMA